MIGPDTYVPTCTVVTGLTVPVAVTVWVIDPRITGAVTKLAGADRRDHEYVEYEAAISAPVRTNQRVPFLLWFVLLKSAPAVAVNNN